jgi:hypothetical protein
MERLRGGGGGGGERARARAERRRPREARWEAAADGRVCEGGRERRRKALGGPGMGGSGCLEPSLTGSNRAGVAGSPGLGALFSRRKRKGRELWPLWRNEPES